MAGHNPVDVGRSLVVDMIMDVSENSGTPKSSILIGFSIINHPFWGPTPNVWKHPYGASPIFYRGFTHFSSHQGADDANQPMKYRTSGVPKRL